MPDASWGRASAAWDAQLRTPPEYRPEMEEVRDGVWECPDHGYTTLREELEREPSCPHCTRKYEDDDDGGPYGGDGRDD